MPFILQAGHKAEFCTICRVYFSMDVLLRTIIGFSEGLCRDRKACFRDPCGFLGPGTYQAVCNISCMLCVLSAGTLGSSLRFRV